MKNFIVKGKGSVIMLLVACVITTVTLGVSREFVLADDSLIRFHVIANSDSEVDQNVKLKVRDAILTGLKDDLADCCDVDDAAAVLAENKETARKIAVDVLAENGFDYNVDVKLTVAEFPTRSYGDLQLPAGKYKAFEILLGEAKGHNWWCVMYPPLCFIDISDSLAVTETHETALSDDFEDEEATEGTDEDDEKVSLKLKFWELFK